MSHPSFLMVTVPSTTAPDSSSALRTSSNKATTLLAGFQPAEASTGPRHGHGDTTKVQGAADAATEGHGA